MEEAIKRQDDASAAVDRLTAGLKEQAATLGMDARAAELYRHEQLGASKESLEAARQAHRDLAGRQKAVRDSEGAARTAEMFGGALKDAGRSTATGMAGMLLRGKNPSMQDLGGLAGNIVGAIPGVGPLLKGGMAGLTAVFELMESGGRQMREKMAAGFDAMLQAGETFQQAGNNLRQNMLREGFQGLGREALDMGNNEGFSANSEAGRRLIGERAGRVVERARRTEAAFLALRENPAIQGMFRENAAQGVESQLQTGIGEAMNRADLGNLRGRLGAENMPVDLANFAVQREQMIQRGAQQAGLTAEQFRQDPRVRGAEQVLAARQRQEAGGMANARIGDELRAGREELDLSTRRLEVIRNLDPFVADMSREEAQLNRERQAGASAEVLRLRGLQVEEIRARRENTQRAEAGRQLTEQTRSPLETFQREEARLQDLRDNGAINEDVFQRGMERAFEQAERAVGEAPVGQAAVMEGSAAAASAIARAQREMRREDPMARVENVMREAQAMQRDMRDRVRDLADVLQRRLARPVNPPGG
jgi:hypothetical protein